MIQVRVAKGFAFVDPDGYLTGAGQLSKKGITQLLADDSKPCTMDELAVRIPNYFEKTAYSSGPPPTLNIPPIPRPSPSSPPNIPQPSPAPPYHSIPLRPPPTPPMRSPGVFWCVGGIGGGMWGVGGGPWKPEVPKQKS